MAFLLKMFLVLHAAAILVTYPFLVASKEVEEEEYDYVKGSKKGPENWGRLKKEWANCSNGKQQSPIDLLRHNALVLPQLGILWRNYVPSRASVKNKGHAITVQWENGAGSIYVQGRKFNLKELHWHSPSEHTIHGIKYDMELHMVHGSSNNQTAVVGILYKIGLPDTFLSVLMDKIKMVAGKKDAEIDAGIVDPWQVKTGTHSEYYRYKGSLTTPPCTEDVKTVSEEQVKLLKNAVLDGYRNNARPTQAINGRDIYFFNPH